jgi:hypothetical protein
MAQHRGITLKKAGEEIGGDKPLSPRTVSAYITRGDLEAYGERGGRRVTTRSIESYLNGERGKWRNDENQAGESHGQDTPPKRKTAHGARFSQSPVGGIMSEKVSIPSRTPKRGLTRLLNSETTKAT